MRVPYIDMEHDRLKAGKEHSVPLSAGAIAILEEMKQLSDACTGGEHADEHAEAYVFPGGKRDRPPSNMAFLMLLHRMKRNDLTASHGFRSTFRDWAAERTNFPSKVAEMALAHTVRSKVEQAYRGGDLFDRRMMAAWSTFSTADS